MIVTVSDGVTCYFIISVNGFSCDLIYAAWKRISGEGKEKSIVRKDNMYSEEGHNKITG